jgi:exosortase A
MFGDWLQSKEDRLSLLMLGTFALAFGLVFFPTWQRLFHSWTSSDDYSHRLLIVTLSLYFLWDRRKELSVASVEPSWSVFPVVLIFLTLYLLAQFAEIRTLESIAMILFLGSSVYFLVGFQFLKQCAFPLFILLFMIPVPAQIYAELTLPLQLFVSKATILIVSFLGIPAVREGNVLYLPEHTLQIVQACSGLRSNISLLLGTLIGYLSLKSNVFRTVLTLFAIPVAVLVNIVRVLVMVMVFYFFDFDLTDGVAHTLFGIAVFCLAVVLFIFIQKGLAFCDK